MAGRWFVLAILTGSYGAGAFGMLGISPLSPSLVAGFGLTRLEVALLALPVVLGWRALGRLDDAPSARAASVARGEGGASEWGWARRPAILASFASGLVLGMVQAAVLSYLPLYTIQALGFDPIGAGLLVACSQAGGAVSRLAMGAASDHWLADRRAVWLAVTGAIGAGSFASYALWQISAPLAAGMLAFATGVGAYGWGGSSS